METYWETFKSPYQMGEQKHRTFLLNLLKDKGVHSILDVGCGTGPIGDLIQKKKYPFKYKGVDYSRSMIKVAMFLMPELTWAVQDMRHLNEKDSSWDCVLLMHSLDHTDDYQKAIAEAARVAQRYVCIVLWRSLLKDGTHLNSVNRMGKEPDEQAFDDTHLQEYSMPALEKEFEKNGLKVVELITDGRINDNNCWNTLFLLQK